MANLNYDDKTPTQRPPIENQPAPSNDFGRGVRTWRRGGRAARASAEQLWPEGNEVMFTKKDEKYTIENLTRDLEAGLIKARAAHVNKHAVENALEQMLRVHRQYIATSLRFWCLTSSRRGCWRHRAHADIVAAWQSLYWLVGGASGRSKQSRRRNHATPAKVWLLSSIPTPLDFGKSRDSVRQDEDQLGKMARC
jgi:hypothetical protein